MSVSGMLIHLALGCIAGQFSLKETKTELLINNSLLIDGPREPYIGAGTVPGKKLHVYFTLQPCVFWLSSHFTKLQAEVKACKRSSRDLHSASERRELCFLEPWLQM